jgi:Flp pilus assembly protein TadG
MSRALFRKAALFAGEQRGVSTLEFALVASPFFLLVLGILQMGVYYLTLSALDAGVLKTAEALRTSYTPNALTATPSGSTLKTNVSANAGAMIANNANLKVDLWQMSSLSTGSQAIVDQHVDSITATGVMVLRAQAQAISFAPMFGATLTVRSSAIFRGGTS